MSGTFLNLGSSLTAEIAGRAGFDWVVIDLEHGAGDHHELLYQLQALEGTPAAPIVRIKWNEPSNFKRVLDLGPSGIMVPNVNTREDAELAVASMQYPPRGIRGAASYNRACSFGQKFDDYFLKADEGLLTVVQIESEQAVDNAHLIAATEGVDVLFVGPLDLSVSLGMPRQFGHAKMRAAMERVVAVAKDNRKAAGILAGNKAMLDQSLADGFTFVGCGSDGSAVADQMRTIASYFQAPQADHE